MVIERAYNLLNYSHSLLMFNMPPSKLLSAYLALALKTSTAFESTRSYADM